MGRGMVQADDPKRVRFPLKQQLKMGANFLRPLPLVNGIQPLPRGIDQTAEEGIPRILLPRGFNPALASLGPIAVAHIRTPMEIRDVKIDQFGWLSRLTQIGLGDIMTG
jgi:hypothetical protein